MDFLFYRTHVILVETMTYQFIIYGRLSGLNKYTAANRTNPHKGSKQKRQNQEKIIWEIKKQLRDVKITKPVLMYYQFYEKDRRRDKDNILSSAVKFIQDSLVKTKVLEDDNQKHIHNFYFDTFVDKENPRIEVTITELTPEQANMTLELLLKDLEREKIRKN